MNLNQKHCTHEPEGTCHKRVNQLRARGYNPAVERMFAAESGSDDYDAHPVWKVNTLPAPLDSDVEIDVVADRLTVWVCGCDDWWFRHSAADGDMAEPSEWSDCKHIRAVSRERRAIEDDSQATL